MSERPVYDWNLIRNFDALLSERSVTRAAARVGVTQSAMSRALGRLRVVFGDELFVRTAAGIEPTPRALALASGITELCERMGDIALVGAEFDPSTASRVFTVVAADYAEWLVMPGLMSRLQKLAPGIEVVFRRALTTGAQYLEQAETDLVLRPTRDEGRNLKSERLFDESFTCIVRAEHPRLGGRRKITLDRFCAEPHVLIAPRSQPGGVVDTVLAKQGRSRRVAARVPTFLVVPELIARTDLVATVPVRLAAAYAPIYGLRVFAPPIEVPGFSMEQVWHPRTDGDLAHMFFRSMISSMFSEG